MVPGATPLGLAEYKVHWKSVPAFSDSALQRDRRGASPTLWHP